MTKPLTLSAQAVFDAYVRGLASKRNNAIAAAIRAAVDQCASKREIHPDSLMTELIVEADDLLAIAAELEGRGDG